MTTTPTLLHKFIKKIEDEILQSEGEIACIERRVSRLKSKLKNPEKSFNEDQAQGTRRFQSVSGEKVLKRKSNLPQLKEKQVLKELINVVPNTQDFEEPKEEKKSSWSLFT